MNNARFGARKQSHSGGLIERKEAHTDGASLEADPSAADTSSTALADQNAG